MALIGRKQRSNGTHLCDRCHKRIPEGEVYSRITTIPDDQFEKYTGYPPLRDVVIQPLSAAKTARMWNEIARREMVITKWHLRCWSAEVRDAKRRIAS